jgi:hypothetical protein
LGRYLADARVLMAVKTANDSLTDHMMTAMRRAVDTGVEELDAARLDVEGDLC